MTKLKVLGYLDDIKNYYKASYGYKEIATKLPAAAVKDMIESMKNSYDDQFKVSAYFTHSTLLLMMLTAFGNVHDSIPLLAANYNQQHNRQFKCNKIVPYGASFAAVKYECSLNQPAKILMLLNQKPISMKWCKLGSICTVDEMERFFENSEMRNFPCDICGNEFAISSAENLPINLLKTANLSCISKNLTLFHHVDSRVDNSSLSD